MLAFGYVSFVILALVLLNKKSTKDVFTVYLILVFSYFLFIYLISIPVVFEAISLFKYLSYLALVLVTVVFFVMLRSLKKSQMILDMTVIVSKIFPYQIQKLFFLFFLVLIIPVNNIMLGFIFLSLITMTIKADNYKIGLVVLVGSISKVLFSSYYYASKIIQFDLINRDLISIIFITVCGLVIVFTIDRLTMPQKEDGSLKVNLRSSIIFVVSQICSFVILFLIGNAYFISKEALIISTWITITLNSFVGIKVFKKKSSQKTTFVGQNPRLLSIGFYLVMYACYMLLIDENLFLVALIIGILYLLMYRVYKNEMEFSYQKTFVPAILLGLICITTIIFNEFIIYSGINNSNYLVSINQYITTTFSSDLDPINTFKNIIGFGIFYNPLLLENISESIIETNNKVILFKSVALFIVINPFTLYMVKIIYDIKDEFMNELIVISYVYIVAIIAIFSAIIIFI